MSSVSADIARGFDRCEALFPEHIAPEDFRVRWVREFLTRVEGPRILDLGCGKGRFLPFLGEGGRRPFGCDLSEILLGSARARGAGRLFRSDGQALGIQDGAFDALIGVEVIEHMPDLDAGLREAVRVLRPGGRLLLVDKNALAVAAKFRYRFFERLHAHQRDLIAKIPAWGPFRERWMLPWKVSIALQGLCREVSVRYAGPRWLSTFVAWEARR